MERRRPRRLRPAAVLAVVVAIATAFLVRLVDVQVVHASALRAESEDRRGVTTAVPGTRGTIVAADGTVLAESSARWTVVASPAAAAGERDLPAAAERIAAALRVPSAGVRLALTRDPHSEYAVLAQQVDLAALDAVQALHVPWLDYRQVDRRVYPDGAVAGNLVGFVGAQGQPQAGLEYGADRCLAGRDGSTIAEASAGGTPIPGTAATISPARQGGTLRLTIDADLQWYAQQTLASRAVQTGARWGSVVVEDARTGHLLAVADWPSVDPDDVGATADADPGALGSRAFTSPYEPGSTMKTITAAALLDAGLATPASRVVAPYRLTTPDGADVNDDEVHGDERLTLAGVLVQSSNTGISQLGARMPDAERYRYLQAFGFGSPTAVGFGAESGGSLGPDAPHWDPQTRLATMFGQGMTTTAVQMASAYAVLADGGVRMPVSLVQSCTDDAGRVTDRPSTTGTRVVSAAAARGTLAMLEDVATRGWLAARVRVPGHRVGIKTGTAQESDGAGGYSPLFLVSMGGVAPIETPRYVVYVDLDAPSKMNTSQAVAPVFQQVMTRVLQREGVPPGTSASPGLPTAW